MPAPAPARCTASNGGALARCGDARYAARVARVAARELDDQTRPLPDLGYGRRTPQRGARLSRPRSTRSTDAAGEPLQFEHRIDDVASHCTFPLSQLGPAYSAALRYRAARSTARSSTRPTAGAASEHGPLLRAALPRALARLLPRIQARRDRLGPPAAQPRGATRARRRRHLDVPVITVITDLGRVHEGWLMPEVDAVVVPAQRSLPARARSAASRASALHSSATRSIRSSKTSPKPRRRCAQAARPSRR